VTVRDWVSFLIAAFGLLLLLADTAVAGGQVRIDNPQWLLPGGLACWLLAWIIAMLPRN